MSELSGFGYVYEGVDEISLKQARRLVELDSVNVFILYDDNTEGMIKDLSIFNEDWIGDVKFGIENQYRKENYVACFVNEYGEEQREIVDYKDKEHLEELKEMYIQEFEAVEVLSFEEADAGGVDRPLLEWEEELFGIEEKELEV